MQLYGSVYIWMALDENYFSAFYRIRESEDYNKKMFKSLNGYVYTCSDISQFHETSSFVSNSG